MWMHVLLCLARRVTNGAPREALSSSATQEIPHSFSNHKARYLRHQSSPMARTNLLLTLAHYSLKIHFNMPPFHLTPLSSSLFKPGSFYLQNSFTKFWLLLRVLHYHSILRNLITPISSADHAATHYGCSPAPRCQVSFLQYVAFQSSGHSFRMSHSNVLNVRKFNCFFI